MKFADIGLSDELLQSVISAGYDTPTPIQAQAIPSVLMMRDLIGIAQTGTGKTASFVLPMIDILAHGRRRALMPRSLILEPTRELAAQVAENFEKYGKNHDLKMALLIGGVQMGDQVKALQEGVDVLIATPGRLMDLFERGKILLTGCNLLVIDEADRMLDMGFIPDIEHICTKLPAQRQTLLFSATMPPPIKKLADKFLSNPKSIEVGRSWPGDLDVLRVRQEAVGELLDRRRHRRREQQRLAVGRQLGADMLDIRDKPHVEHAVSLVDHQQVASGEQDLAAFEQVHQPARRRDQYVDAFVERLDLIAHLHAADQQRHLEVVVLAVLLEILGDLRGEFARRLEDQRARHHRATAAMRQNVDHRQHEARRLAGPGLRDADDVLHHQHWRDGLRLDRSRFVITGIEDRLQQFV